MTRPFDVCGPLPSGVTVLEASAGTGKTYTIAALAARYVAAGTPLHELLLVTFTRMATGELRERVRERLVSAEQALSRSLAGAPPGDEDRVLRLLADAPPAELRRRRDRLARALADFDAATIATTHGFCQEVLAGLGVAGDAQRDEEFLEDVADLRDEVVDDLYVRRFHRHDGAPPFGRHEAGVIATVAVANPTAPIEPSDAAAGSVPAMRQRLAQAVRAELARRKAAAGVLTYDDLVTRLDGALGGPGGALVAARLRARYRVVLVDEFQDTDPVQWDIMRRAFGEGGVTLVLIGDPKQAIYAFRGADVYAYLEAAREAAEQATLEINWRSDQGLIDAYDALFGGARLGHEGIVYRRVRATPANQRPRLAGAPVDVPLRVRVVHRDEPSVRTTRRGYATNASAREHVATDLAGDLVRLLDSGALIERRPVTPGDVAVLVQTNRTAADIRDALAAVGVPAVINGAGSVFGTPLAGDWLRLLEALERPTSGARARAAALTPFLGWSAQRIATAPEEELALVHRRMHEWARVLRLTGVASLLETITLLEGLPERVLRAPDGERRMTDLRHIGQLLHAAATAEQLGTAALVAWLRRRIAEADQDTADEDRSRRLESDAEAVQVLTVHRSKGLEFPIVYYPFLWEPGYIRDGVPVVFHDPQAHDVRTVDVGLEGPDFERHKRQHLIERRGEDLRLAYVALTRAQHQAIVWWAGSFNSRDSALGRLLFARRADGTVAAQGSQSPSDDEAWARLAELAEQAPGCIGVERSRLGMPAWWSRPVRAPAALEAARFDRELDWRWRRTSFSDITAGVGEARVGSEPEQAAPADEPAASVHPAPACADDPLRGVPSLLSGMPAGAQVGTFVHRVLESTDFAAPDLDAELAARMAGALARRAVEVGDPAAVAAGLRAAIETPLGDLRLRDLARADRLDELDFELPLVGGDEPTGRLALAAIGGVLREHLPAGDPLAGYAERLGDPVLRSSVRGFVTGTIDLVARAGGRFTVVDYKTNWLAAPDEELSAWHYRPAALAAEMQRAHYGLQALLYTVALHRYLRWRMPGYRADRDLGGVLYLFLRGMTGADGGACGVFRWRPPGALVEALSDVLDRGRQPMIAAGAAGLLREFNEAAVLAPADVHVARRLAGLAGERDERVALAVALAVRGPRLGHVYVDLATIHENAAVDTEEPVDLAALPWPEAGEWVARVAASALVGVGEEGGGERPLRLVGSALYLDRYWREERRVAADLLALRDRPGERVDEALLRSGLARMFDDDSRQRLAAETAVRRRFAVVAGGPGTGKTTTVARIVALLLEQAAAAGEPEPLVALAAPTGKAAARLSEAVHAEAAQLETGDDVRARLAALEASTLHRLLGWRPGTHSRFRHDRANRLPHDVVIVDETSMVSLWQMARLVEAVRADARVILVGDPGQLASIEAGAVLGDIVGPAGGSGIVVLDRVHRYGGAIARVAEAIRRGDADAVLAALEGVTWIGVDAAEAPGDLRAVRDRAVAAGRAVTAAAIAGAGAQAIEALGAFRVLCAHRRGAHGVAAWTARIEGWLSDALAGLGGEEWYVGRPLLVTENDYALRLFNGDTGVVVASGPGRVSAAFERQGEIAELSPSRLSAIETVYAMTVHKSQGSQFDTAAVLLPEPTSPILTRELLYTAVTRARRELILVGTEDAIRVAVARPVARASGLRARLWGAAG